jgi:anti-sigma factor RsiW
MTRPRQARDAHCRVDWAHWSRYAEGEFSSAECRRCETHLAGCPACRARLREVHRTIAVCRRAGRAVLPPAVKARARRKIAELLTNRR